MSDRKLVVAYRGATEPLPSGDTAVTSQVALTNNGEVQFRELSANGSNYVALKAAANMTANVTFRLPSVDGSTGHVLKTDGSGNLSFSAASGGSVTYYQETPTGTVNSSNVTFTLSSTPASSASVRVFKNGLLVQQLAGAGNYTISGSTITFGTAPTTGSDIYAVYSSATNVIQETPSGTVNSSNVTFTLANTPSANASIEVFLDGLLQRQGAGAGKYTVSSSTITFGTAPASGQEVYAVYTLP